MIIEKIYQAACAILLVLFLAALIALVVLNINLHVARTELDKTRAEIGELNAKLEQWWGTARECSAKTIALQKTSKDLTDAGNKAIADEHAKRQRALDEAAHLRVLIAQRTVELERLKQTKVTPPPFETPESPLAVDDAPKTCDDADREVLKGMIR